MSTFLPNPSPNAAGPFDEKEFTVKQLAAGGYLVTINKRDQFGPCVVFAASTDTEAFDYIKRQFGWPCQVASRSVHAHPENLYRDRGLTP